jgi:hypothetical protein
VSSWLYLTSKLRSECLSTECCNKSNNSRGSYETFVYSATLTNYDLLFVPIPGNLPPNASTNASLTKADAVSTVPTMVRGDWVLFHPVYTPEEMKAVEVCLCLG